ncbi:hypothetical protein [Marinactinospora rubrisoli]|uniref:CGNR zinc finger domain-containing protein n=1 Tax=Marinactinospora rubrisoli TaxID=2715399 RepID=A0ABW2KNM6_9ACTN
MGAADQVREACRRAAAHAAEHGDWPEVSGGHLRILAALEGVAAALRADPTLDRYRSDPRTRWLDLVPELARQAGPLGRMVVTLRQWQDLERVGDDRQRERARARLGRVHHGVPEEFAQLVERTEEIAGRVTASVYADPPTPAQLAELAAHMVPGLHSIARETARELRARLAPLREVGYLPPEALRLLAIADALDAPAPRPGRCVCGEPITQPGRQGRPRRYCSDTCRRRAHRAARRTGAPPRA